MTAVGKSYTEGLKGLDTEETKLRKYRIWAEYEESLPIVER